MRVLLVASRYLPHLGGVENVVWNLTQELTQLGHQVRIVASRYPRTLPAYELIGGVPVRRLIFLYPRLEHLRNRRFDLFAGGFWYCPSTLWALRRELMSFRPDVLHMHFLGAAGLFLLLQHHLHPFRWVVTLHGDDVEGLPPRRPLDHWLFHRVLDHADRVTACSKALLGEALALHPAMRAKATVVCNGIDLTRFMQGSPFDHPRRYVFAVGQLARKKGFDVLLRAFAELKGEFPEVDLLIAGDGVERQALESLLADLGLRGRAVLLGRTEPPDVVRLLKGSLFQVVPSILEPFGIVALEGMAAGKVVLATRTGGLPEFVDGVGLLVEPGDVRSLASGLRLLLTDSSLRAELGARGLQQAKRFAWSEQIVPQYLTLYQG